MPKAQAKAQFASLVVFSIINFGAIAITIYEPSISKLGAVGLILNLDAYLACVLAGYLAAAIARKRGAVMGALAGLLALCVVTIYHLASGPSVAGSGDWRFWLASILSGSLGGVLWRLRESALRLKHH